MGIFPAQHMPAVPTILAKLSRLLPTVPRPCSILLGGGRDGYYPEADLIRDGSGNLFGTTQLSGPRGDKGAVFELKLDGTEKMLGDFACANDGCEPQSALIAG